MDGIRSLWELFDDFNRASDPDGHGSRDEHPKVELFKCSSTSNRKKKAQLVGAEQSSSQPTNIPDIPEDVLCDVLARLTLREAARASVLSPAWKQAWRCYPYLTFNCTILHAENRHIYATTTSKRLEDSTMKQQTERFVEIVDTILQHHSGFEVKTLKVEFNLHKKHSVYIDGWISFAIRSKARVIVLDFRPMCFPTKEEPYVFPCHLFTAEQQPCIEYLRLNVCSFKPSLQFSGLDSLKTLDLCHVDITDDGIQILLSNCFCLEYLRLEKCDELVNLTASHALCCLQHLVVRDCGSLRKIDLDVINLSCFEFNGYMMDINFRAASRLVDAWIGIHCPVNVFRLLSDMAIALPQLRTLILHLGSAQNEMVPTTLPADLNTFMHLEHLDLRVLLWEDMLMKDVLGLGYILDMAPVMQKLKVNLHNDKISYGYFPSIRRLPASPHYHLKEVEISGFTIDRTHVELAAHFLKNAMSLEVLHINPYYRPIQRGDKLIIHRFKREAGTVWFFAAHRLKDEVPSHARLEFL